MATPAGLHCKPEGGVGRRAPAVALALAIGLTLPHSVVAQQATVESPTAATLHVTSATEAANTHFWAGIDEWENIRFRTAAQHFDQALAADPTFGLARVIHGFVTPGLQQQARAEEIERGFVDLAGATAAELALATAIKEWNAGNNENATTLLAATAKLTPGDRHVAYLHAVSALNVNQSEGLQALRKVAERFPDFAPVQNILAYTLWNTGDHEGAFQAVRKYVELVPNHPNPYDSYAELLQWDGRFEDAAQQYRNSIQRDPNFDQAYFGLAEVARLSRRTNEIRGFIEQGIEHAPTTQAGINGRRALANAYLIQGNYRAAMTELATVARESAANDIDWLTTLAHQQMALTDAMFAKGADVDKHLQAAAAVGGEDTPAQHAWATWAYAAAGKTEMARQHARQLEMKAKDAPNWETGARSANAMLYLRDNKVEQALKEIERADPTNIVVRAQLAECYAKMGRKAEADALTYEVLNDRTVNFYNPMVPIAMTLAAKKR